MNFFTIVWLFLWKNK